MRERIRLKGEFIKNVFTLMTGTIAAQLFLVAVSPILTRIYTPADFGVLALFTALNSVLSIVAAGRYETAIMLPKEDADALNIVALAAALTLSFSMVMEGIIYVFFDELIKLANTPLADRWIYLLPLSVTFSAGTQIMILWNNRRKKFKQLATSRALYGLGSGTSQCSLGYVPGVSFGLIIGNIVGSFLGLVTLIKANLGSFKAGWPSISWVRIKENAKAYRRFPLFSLWGALFDTSASQVPLFMIASFFSVTVTGYFGFTIKVLSLPLFLISSAVSEVFFQKITQLDTTNPAELRRYVLRIFTLLTCIAVPFCLLFISFGIEIFSFVFGKNWAQAGQFAGPLSIAAGVRFMVSPLSVVLNLNHNVKKGASWQVTYFCTLTTVLLTFSDQPIDVFLHAFVAHEVVLFSIYFIVIVRASKHRKAIDADDTSGTLAVDTNAHTK
ncbi:oligosaccharide flippase family protein [Alcaligenaceae bacterium]|nr:oligosaccharide flippase family protein [Alcaligenaceae bacterium]